MDYLVDTNVFINIIEDYIYAVAYKCFYDQTPIVITKTILDELLPGQDKIETDSDIKEPFIIVNNLSHGTMGQKLIQCVDLESIPEAKKEYKRIRTAFYSWMTDTHYLQKLVDEGKLTSEEIKGGRFRKKDCGECELIAIAMTNKGKHTIVSNDIGRVYKHPEQNLFDDYAIPNGVTVIGSDKWHKQIGWTCECGQVLRVSSDDMDAFTCPDCGRKYYFEDGELKDNK
jgi:hypothetical protein